MTNGPFNNMHKRTPRELLTLRDPIFASLQNANNTTKRHRVASRKVRVSIRTVTKHSPPRRFLCARWKKRWPVCDQCSAHGGGDEMAFLQLSLCPRPLLLCASGKVVRGREARSLLASLDSNITRWLILRRARDAFLPARRAKLINLCCRRVELKWFLPVYKLIFHARPREINDRNKRERVHFLLGFN